MKTSRHSFRYGEIKTWFPLHLGIVWFMKNDSLLLLEKNSSLNKTRDQLSKRKCTSKILIDIRKLNTYVNLDRAVRKAIDRKRCYCKVGMGSCARIFFTKIFSVSVYSCIFFLFFLMKQNILHCSFSHLRFVLFYAVYYFKDILYLSFHILHI